MTEAELQRAVIGVARFYGYLVAHFRPALTQSGRWSTPVQGDGAGFPDLVLVGHGRVLFVELKSARGRLSPQQARWLARLELAADRIETYVWRPADWDAGVVGAVLAGTASNTEAA